MDRIESQEKQGGRLKSSQLGVLDPDPAIDMQRLTQNYTAFALASALRDREESLQQAAVLAKEGKIEELVELLRIFHPDYVVQRRQPRRLLDATVRLDSDTRQALRKTLMRLPRTVVSAHVQRAAVVVPLCLVNGTPSLLLEKRAPHLRAHPDEVCLPGGMVCQVSDATIVSTCLREMNEEIGGLTKDAEVLGVFRCNWGEVHHMVGIAVTPVVCYLGELPDELYPNEEEVSQVFTIPLASLLDEDFWEYRKDLAPIFLGGPHPIWGLTGYILDRLGKDVLLPNSGESAPPVHVEKEIPEEDL